jgi:hypothetical protein
MSKYSIEYIYGTTDIPKFSEEVIQKRLDILDGELFKIAMAREGSDRVHPIEAEKRLLLRLNKG